MRRIGFDAADKISIHAPREGSDHSARSGLTLTAISIHAPREGSDRMQEQMQILL